MRNLYGVNYILNIRRYIRISFFVASIIPLALLVFITINYVSPNLSFDLLIYVEIVLLLAVVLSILGLALLTRTTNASILALQDLYLKLSILIKNVKQFREIPYTDMLLENIAKATVDLTYSEGGVLYLFDGVNSLKPKITVGSVDETMTDGTVEKWRGIPELAAKKGEPIIVSDTDNNKHYNLRASRKTGAKARSLMCIPLTYNKQNIGVIEVFNKLDGVFTEEDKELSSAFVDQAAISIMHNRLIENQRSDFTHIMEILIDIQDFFISNKHRHSRRVAVYANLIGRKMGLAETELKNLHYAALLHDIGMLRIAQRETHLKEPWPREIFIKHPQLGYEMIKQISFCKDAADIILYHHERFDGTGYLTGKKGNEIPIGSRILFVADVFDVLTSKYSYKKPGDYGSALYEVEANSGSQFDPEVIKAFKASIKDSDLIID